MSRVWWRRWKSLLNKADGGVSMIKKRITLTLEVENEDGQMSDDYIKNDLEVEINCASNSYDIIGFETETLGKK